jgi:hypothetical protein
VTKEIEVDPRSIAASFRAAQKTAVKLPGFIDIPDLDGEMERAE